MGRRSFDRYMVQVGMGSHPKFARLSDSEFRAHVVGVLSVAAIAPIRGCLLVGELEAEPADIARAAGVTVRVASSAVSKLQALGVLYRDDELGCLRVHDWDDINPEPRVDATAAERQRRLRERRSNGDVTRDSNGCHTPSNGDVTPPTARMRASSSTSPSLLTGTTEDSSERRASDESGAELPEDFPEELLPHLRIVFKVLRDLARRHDAKAVTALSLGSVVMARPRKPLVRAAHDFAAWADGKASRRKDVVAGYRNWLDRTDDLATLEPLNGNGLLSSRDERRRRGAAALENLMSRTGSEAA